MLNKMRNLQCTVSWAPASGLCLKQHFFMRIVLVLTGAPFSSYSITDPENQAQKLLDTPLANQM